MEIPIPLSQKGRLICFAVRLQPGAGRSEVTGAVERALRVTIAAPALGNRANDALIVLLADLLDLPKSHVVLLQGRKSRLKLIGVAGLEKEELATRLHKLL